MNMHEVLRIERQALRQPVHDQRALAAARSPFDQHVLRAFVQKRFERANIALAAAIEPAPRRGISLMPLALPVEGIQCLLSRIGGVEDRPKIALQPLGERFRRRIVLDYRETAGADALLQVPLTRRIRRGGEIVVPFGARVIMRAEVEQRPAGHRRVI